MFIRRSRRRRKSQRLSTARQLMFLIGLVLILLSSMGGSLPILEDARAQDDPQATDVPELVKELPIEDDQKQDVETPEEPKATEPVTDNPQPTEIPKTEAPELTEKSPVETRAVETEAVVTEAVPSPTEDPEFGSTGEALWASNHLVVDVHGCPAGVDAAASSPAQLESTCGDNVGPVSFSLDNGWLGNHYFITNGGIPRNHAVFNDLDIEDDYSAANAGDGRQVVLAASFPAGYVSVAVSCAYWNEAAGVIDWGPAIMPLAGDRAIKIAVDAGDTLFCDWYFLPPRYQGEDSAVFDIPPIAPTPTELDTTTPEPPRPADPEETGSVHIVKYTCHEGYDLSGAGFPILEKDCRDDGVLTEFTVSTIGMYNETRAARLTLPPFMREAEFEDVPATTIYIQETILPGFGEPIVYCAVDARTVAEWIPQRVNGGDTVYWKLEPDSRLTCYFFNVQAEGGEKDDPESIQGEDSAVFEIPPIAPKADTVSVIKFTCGPGVLPNEEYFRLYDQCHENPGPVEFTVRGEGGYSRSAFSDGSIPRAAVFTDVPFGHIEISETIPAGYGEPIAFCSDSAAAPPPVPVDGNAVVWDLRSGAADALECIFFNFPEGGEKVDPDAGVVRITKLTCRAGDASSTFIDLRSRCREYADPVEFSVASGSGYRESEFTSFAGRPAFQEAGFTNVPFGKIEISETVPAGNGEPRVWCTDDELAAEAPEVPAPGGLFVGEFSGTGEHMVCTVFNFLDTGGDKGNIVTVHKYICSTRTFISTVDCGVYEYGTTFDLLVREGGSWDYAGTKTTGSDGLAIFGPIEPGQYRLDEHDGGWCHIASDSLTGDGETIGVEAGQETMVVIYNCDGVPGKPGEIPTTFPNTGVPPARNDP